jgi:hypothetical protein
MTSHLFRQALSACTLPASLCLVAVYKVLRSILTLLEGRTTRQQVLLANVEAS